MTLYTTLVFALFSALMVPVAWVTPATGDLLVMAGMGLLAGFGQLTITEAFRIAPSAVIAPYEYSSLVWAVLFGLLLWGEWPSRDVVLGVVVLILTGLYLLRRERRARR
jgi:drug/metabolite transporter (DMT)-like permease